MTMLHGSHGRVLDRALQSPPRQPGADQVAPAPTIGSWQPTALLHRGRLNIFRARPVNGQNGPGCYVLKVDSATSDRRLVRAMLTREAAVADSVQHHNLLSVLASGLRNDATPFIVLPYLEGLSLAQWRTAAPRRQLPFTTALWIARQIAEALAALHSAGWLHGQVRPEHIIISPQGHATLLDLSLARRLDTAECATGGHSPDAPLYAAPEAFSSRGVFSPATDLYCLGLILFELLTGRRPFANLHDNQLATAHLQAAPLDLRSLRPAVPHDLAFLLGQLLAKQPLRRPGAFDLIHLLTELEIEALAS